MSDYILCCDVKILQVASSSKCCWRPDWTFCYFVDIFGKVLMSRDEPSALWETLYSVWTSAICRVKTILYIVAHRSFNEAAQVSNSAYLKNLATNRPQEKLVGWSVNTKAISARETTEISFLDKENLLKLSVEFESMTSQSLSCGFHTLVSSLP